MWSCYIQLLGQSFVVLQVLPELDVLALISCELGFGIIKLRLDSSTLLASHVIPSLYQHATMVNETADTTRTQRRGSKAVYLHILHLLGQVSELGTLGLLLGGELCAACGACFQLLHIASALQLRHVCLLGGNVTLLGLVLLRLELGALQLVALLLHHTHAVEDTQALSTHLLQMASCLLNGLHIPAIAGDEARVGEQL